MIRAVLALAISYLVAGLGLLNLSNAADAQRAAAPRHIGVLVVARAPQSEEAQAFRRALLSAGYSEGSDVVIEWRAADGDYGRVPELVADLVQRKVDVLVVESTIASQAAKRATSTIPIVMTTSSDPVAQGLVASLGRPGANVTGLSSLGADLNKKRLEILKDVIPKLTRVALLQSPGSVSSDLQLKELRPAAVALQLKLEEIDTQPDAKGLESAFETAKQKHVNAITMVATRAFFAERKRIVELAEKHRVPAIYFQREFVDDGGLMSYGVDYDDLFRKAAHYVDKILKGANPADLSVQQATEFKFVVNLKAAKQIGLTVPNRVLERATEVIR